VIRSKFNLFYARGEKHLPTRVKNENCIIIFNFDFLFGVNFNKYIIMSMCLKCHVSFRFACVSLYTGTSFSCGLSVLALFSLWSNCLHLQTFTEYRIKHKRIAEHNVVTDNLLISIQCIELFECRHILLLRQLYK